MNQEAIKRAVVHGHTILQQAPDGIFMIDFDTNILYVNPAFCDLLGYTKEELIGSNITQHLGDISILANCMQQVEKHGCCIDQETIFKKKDGSIVHISKNVQAIEDDNGNIAGIVVFIRDMTRLHHLNTQLVSANEQLNQLQQGLKEKISEQTHLLEMKNTQLEKLNQDLNNQIKIAIEKNREQEIHLIQKSRLAQLGELIGMIAHQWRQPLAGMGASIIDLKLKLDLNTYDCKQSDSEESLIAYIHDSLSVIESQVMTLSHTIDDFRNFYKVDNETKHLGIDIPIMKAINTVKPVYEAKQIIFTFEHSATRSVDMYMGELMQVFLNIFKNAEDNFVERDCLTPMLAIKTQDHDSNGVIITICDNGGGIDESILEKIFDPYFSTKDERNGSGLGLYMSKTIIENHHKGRLSVRNQNGGACFIIELKQHL